MSQLSEQDYQKILWFLHGLYSVSTPEEFTSYVETAIPPLMATEMSSEGHTQYQSNPWLNYSPRSSLPIDHSESSANRDDTLLDLLQPHLTQVCQNIQILCQIQQTNQTLQACLSADGSIVVNPAGQIQTITPQARHLLSQYCRDFKPQGQVLPRHVQGWFNSQQALLSHPNSDSSYLSPLTIEQGERCLKVLLAGHSVKQRYLILLSEQKRSTLTVSALEILGISRREAEVLFWVINGKSNAEIADMLSVTIKTVRKHLEHIYLKLGVQDRVAAVVAAFKGLGLLNLD
jgi:DNA-binding CsgD family transcriptional regulator